jgi:hypothetical protein
MIVRGVGDAAMIGKIPGYRGAVASIARRPPEGQSAGLRRTLRCARAGIAVSALIDDGA